MSLKNTSFPRWYTAKLLSRNEKLQGVSTELRYHCEVYKLGLQSIQKILLQERSRKSSLFQREKALKGPERYGKSHMILSQKTALEKIGRAIRKVKLYINGYSHIKQPTETKKPEGNVETEDSKVENDSVPRQTTQKEINKGNHPSVSLFNPGISSGSSYLASGRQLPESNVVKADEVVRKYTNRNSASHIRESEHVSPVQIEKRQVDKHEDRKQDKESIQSTKIRGENYNIDKPSDDDGFGSESLKMSDLNSNQYAKAGSLLSSTRKFQVRSDDHNSPDPKLRKRLIERSNSEVNNTEWPGKRSGLEAFSRRPKILRTAQAWKIGQSQSHSERFVRNNSREENTPRAFAQNQPRSTNNSSQRLFRTATDTNNICNMRSGRRTFAGNGGEVDGRNEINKVATTWWTWKADSVNNHGHLSTNAPITPERKYWRSVVPFTIRQDAGFKKEKQNEGKVRRVNVYPENDDGYYRKAKDRNRSLNKTENLRYCSRPKNPKQDLTDKKNVRIPDKSEWGEQGLPTQIEIPASRLVDSGDYLAVKGTDRKEDKGSSFSIPVISLNQCNAQKAIAVEDPRLQNKRYRDTMPFPNV